MINLILSAAIGLSTLNGNNIEIRFQPGEVVFVYENRGIGSSPLTYSAIIQNLAIVNKSKDAVTFHKLKINAYQGGKVLQSKFTGQEAIERAIQKMDYLKQNGYLELMEFQLQLKQYLQDADLAASNEVQPNEAVVLSHQVLLFDALPDSLVVTAYGTSNEQAIDKSTSIRIENYQNKNTFSFPLKGRWMAAAGPSLIGHHRWGLLQEFAFDLLRLGDGTLTYINDGQSLEDYYAYGESVYAAADGKVVAIMDNIEETTEMLMRPGESETDFVKRTMSVQQELMMKGIKYIMGNQVVIEHPGGEYSYYLHLKAGSIKVKVGDNVRLGEKIAELGNSGNSTEPHLHFHLTDGPDISTSRSLPISFDNITLYPDDNGMIRHLHSGQIIQTK